MDSTLKPVLVILLILYHGADSQFQFSDDIQTRKNYNRDYPDIVDYDDTRAGSHLRDYLLNEQYARDDVNQEISYFDPDNYKSGGYEETPFHRNPSDMRNSQRYQDSHAFLSNKQKQYDNEQIVHSNVGRIHGKEKSKKDNLPKKDKSIVADIKKPHVGIESKVDSHRVVKDKFINREIQNSANDKRVSLSLDTVAVKENSADSIKKQDISSSPSSKRTSSTSVAAAPVPQPKSVSSRKDNTELDDAFFGVVVAACSVAGVAGLALAGYCWYKLRKEAKDITEGEIVGYSGNTGEKLKANYGGNNGDEKLTKSAEMYHYLHAKKHLTAMDSNGKDGAGKRLHIHDASDTSDEESDNTVYECPGLAPPGDMKVVNPLFSDAESRHSDRHSDHHSDAKSEESASSTPPLRVQGRSSMSSASSKP